MPESRAQVRYAHSVLAGRARKKNGMPPAVAREIVGKMKGQSMYDLPEKAGNPVPKKKRKRRLFGSKKKVTAQEILELEDVTQAARRRGMEIREAARAIEQGHAEAHPTAVEQGLYGPISGVPEEELKDIGETFADSLIRTWKARQKGKKKKPPVPRMPAPQPGQEIARR